MGSKVTGVILIYCKGENVKVRRREGVWGVWFYCGRCGARLAWLVQV